MEIFQQTFLCFIEYIFLRENKEILIQFAWHANHLMKMYHLFTEINHWYSKVICFIIITCSDFKLNIRLTRSRPYFLQMMYATCLRTILGGFKTGAFGANAEKLSVVIVERS